MNYLKNYNITDEQIKKLKDKYNDGIINFLSENEEFIKDKINYLKKEGFVLLYEMLEQNIKIFLETTSPLKKKVEKMKRNNMTVKAMQMVLLSTEIYDRI